MMEMRPVIARGLLLCGLLLCLVNAISVINALDNSNAKLGSIDPPLMWIQPYLIYPNDPTKMEILCETDKDVANDNDHIYIDISGADGSLVNGWTRSHETIPIYGKPDRKLWTFAINNLNPSHVYNYQIYYRDNDGNAYNHTPVYNFSTSPDQKTNPSQLEFAAFGDTRAYTQADRDHINMVAKALEQHLTQNTAFVIHAGDLVPYGGDDGKGRDTWQTDYFDTDVRNWMHHLPLFTTLGNHDFAGVPDNPLEYYYSYFPYPMYEGRNGMDTDTYYYSFDWGPAHFVSLDSFPLDKSANKDPNSAQYKWLEKDLASTDRKWKIAFMHVPFYTSTDCRARDDEGRTYFQPLFEKYGVNLVLAGHAHWYSHTLVNDTPYLILGGGGASLTDPYCGDSTDHKCHICDKDLSPCFVDNGCHDFLAYKKYHFAYFRINSNDMTCKVIDENNNLIDEFSYMWSSLSPLKSETQNIQRIIIKNQTADSWGSATAGNNVHLEA